MAWVLAGAATLLVVFALATLPRVALASGEAIHVISDQQEGRFPDGVSFHLVLDAESDIVEVRLDYRIAEFGVWTYAYSSISPTQPTEASLTLSTSGAVYLPPGTELEYFYSIRDAEGNVLRTSPMTFTYMDQRFEWENTRIGPLTLYWHDRPSGRVERVAQRVAESLDRVESLLGVGLDKPVKGFIYNSFAEATLALPVQSETLSQQNVFQGFAFGSQGVFVAVGLEPSLIVHEMTHLLLRQAVGSRIAALPAWFNEGLSSYVEPGPHRSFMGSLGSASNALPLRHMSTVPGRADDIRLFYAKAESVTGYLIETYGAESLRHFIGLLDQGLPVNEALGETYDFDVDGLEARWLETNLSRGGGTRPPWVFLETTLIGILVLLVMAVVVVRALIRRVARRAEGLEEMEEPLEPEGW